VYFTADDNRVVIDAADGVMIGNIQTGRIEQPWTTTHARRDAFWLEAFDSKRTRMVLRNQNDSSAMIVDLADGEQVDASLQINARQYLEFSADGTKIVAWGTDGLKMWEVSSGESLVLPAELESFAATAFAISDDGTDLIVTGYADKQAVSSEDPGPGVAITLDLATRQVTGNRIFLPAGPPENVTFRGSAATLVTPAKVFLAEPVLTHLDLRTPSDDELAEAACESIGRRWLNEDEWQEYVGDEPFQNPCET
jgi:hypothetical protein